ncbi:MAG: hypothetical protein KGV43_03820 [Arcobacter sp.]|nr:hypothetical protein [Arcobacter sp.]
MKVNILLSVIIVLVVFNACGSGGSENKEVSNSFSKLYDGEVIGISYENLTSGEKGKTDRKGFPYKFGDEVKFFVGSLTLGSTKVNSNKVFLPKLFGLNDENISDERVIKVATLLQALDSDKNDDIITIDENKIPQKIKNINKNITQIKINQDILGLNLPSKEEVLKELQKTLKEYFTKEESKVSPEEKKEENKVNSEEPKVEEKKEENKVSPEKPKAEENLTPQKEDNKEEQKDNNTKEDEANTENPESEDSSTENPQKEQQAFAQTHTLKLIKNKDELFTLLNSEDFKSNNDLNKIKRDYPYNGYTFNTYELEEQLDKTKVDELKLDMGEEIPFRLVDENHQEVTEVKYYLLMRYPLDKIFTQEQTQTDSLSPMIIKDKKIIVKSKSTLQYPDYDHSGEIIALYTKNGKQYLNRIAYTIKTEEQTKITKLQKQADDEIKQILAPAINLSDVDKATYIFDYLAKNIKYNLNSAWTPQVYSTILKQEAVCWGYATAYTHLAKKLGLNVQTKIGSVTFTDIKHAWNMIELNDKWYYLDSTWASTDNGIEFERRKNDENFKANHKYLLLNTKQIQQEHITSSWDDDKAMGEEYLFYDYKQNSMFIENEQDLEKAINIIKDNLLDGGAENNIDLIVSKNISQLTIKNTIKNHFPDTYNNGRIASTLSSANIDEGNTSYTLSTDYYKYNNVYYVFGDIYQKVNPTITAKNGESLTRTLEITLDKAVDLKLHNIKIKNANKKELKKLSDTQYELIIENLATNEVELTITKTGYTFDKQKVQVNFTRANKPNTYIVGVSSESFIFKNVKEGDMYNLGDGKWKAAKNDEIIKTRATFILVKNKTQGKADSLHQEINLIRQDVIPSYITVDEKMVKNLSSRMEYKEQNSDKWLSIYEDTIKLPSGIYEFRFKARIGVYASDIKTITIP